MPPSPDPDEPARERFGDDAIGWIRIRRGGGDGGGDCCGVTVGVVQVEPGKEADRTTTSGGANPAEEGSLGNVRVGCLLTNGWAPEV